MDRRDSTAGSSLAPMAFITAADLPQVPGPPRQPRDLPDPPRALWRIVGPGVVAAGVGLSSGEFVLWPYIASQVGLVFVWGAMLGVVTQLFLNLEIERYTLATGETALSGFNRFWPHWGLVLTVLVYFANLWPGWAVTAATLTSYLTGGDVRIIAVAFLISIGAALTLAPIVYVALERLIFVKVAGVLVLVAAALWFAIDGASWRALALGLTMEARVPTELGIPLLLGAAAFAGAGGGQNLCQSNWIRDKGFGMGIYVPRLVSPVTGKEEAAPAAVSYAFAITPVNMARWRRWWRFANLEQALTFGLVTVITIALTSMLAHATLYGSPDLPNDVTFLLREGQALQALVAPWFATLFWVIGALSLYGSAMGIIDYTSRLAADVLKSTYLRDASISESRIYFRLVWGLVAMGTLIIASGFNQPLVLLVISACTGGVIMFIYSLLLIRLNRRLLPQAVAPGGARIAALVWSALAFGVLSLLTVWSQLQRVVG
jgi:hypothetical protein